MIASLRAVSLLLVTGRIFVCSVIMAISTPTFAAEIRTVKIDMFAFGPRTLTVPAGTKVTWTNLDEEPHTVFSPNKSFRSDALDTGESFSFVFARPGTYKYFCSIHPHMKGTVVVTPGSGG